MLYSNHEREVNITVKIEIFRNNRTKFLEHLSKRMAAHNKALEVSFAPSPSWPDMEVVTIHGDFPTYELRDY